MSTTQLHVISPDPLAEFVRTAPLQTALEHIAGLADAELRISDGSEGQSSPEESLGPAETLERPVRYNGHAEGCVRCQEAGPPGTPASTQNVERAATAVSGILEHLLDREMAVTDLAEALVTSYEELNVLYTLLPDIATRASAQQVAEVLVDQAARTLHCGRVSLLVLDESGRNLKVLASRGLPADVNGLVIPVEGSISEHALLDEDLLFVNDPSERPDLHRRSRGNYEGTAFAVARVPLKAQGQPIGVLAVTERGESPEFTARDRKLLEAFSAMAASALLSCRLHAAVNRQMMGTIQALAAAVDAKDPYTHDHSGRVARMCVATAQALGIRDDVKRREIELSGLLHDIGKIGIPDAILSKPGRLTAEEFRIIKNHALIGAQIVRKVDGLEQVACAILHHHERFDGLGYPDGLSRDEIPLASKLIAVADTFDSLTSDRSYRKAASTEMALRELHRCAGTQFDPAVVEAFADAQTREHRSP